LSLTPVIVISVAVIRSIPTSTFKESKSERRHLHVVDQTRSHDFVSELSSFEVGTSSTRGTRVFHIGTLKSRATEMLSKLGSKRFNNDNLASSTVKSSRRDGHTLEVLIQTVGESEGMDNFMHNTHHVLFMEKNISGFLEVVSVDSNITNQRSLAST
jgi:hypothetical protein